MDSAERLCSVYIPTGAAYLPPSHLIVIDLLLPSTLTDL